MSFAEELTAIQCCIDTIALPIPFRYPNVVRSDNFPDSDGFVKVNFLNGTRRQTSLTSTDPRREARHVLQMQIFTPTEPPTAGREQFVGDLLSRQYADLINDVLERKSITLSNGCILFFTGQLNPGRNVEAWWMNVYTIEYVVFTS